jgi:hypothetical protein
VVQRRDVLARDLARARRHAVAAQDLKLLDVNVNRVHPPAGVVLQSPLLDGVLLHAKPDVAAVGVHEPAVDLPLAVAALKLQGAGHARRRRLVGQRVKAHGRGIGAAIGDRHRSLHPELHDEIARARGERVARRPSAVELLESVFEVQRFARPRAEVDDDVLALGDTHGDAVHADGLRQEIAVVRDEPVRDLLVGSLVVKTWYQREGPLFNTQAVAPRLTSKNG